MGAEIRCSPEQLRRQADGQAQAQSQEKSQRGADPHYEEAQMDLDGHRHFLLLAALVEGQ